LTRIGSCTKSSAYSHLDNSRAFIASSYRDKPIYASLYETAGRLFPPSWNT
jgi:hypothetical protein